MDEVLYEKYHFTKESAQDIASFMTQLIQPLPSKRATAAELIDHPWLKDVVIEGLPNPEDILMDGN